MFRDYGAHPDGSTNSTEAFHSAIQAVKKPRGWGRGVCPGGKLYHQFNRPGDIISGRDKHRSPARGFCRLNGGMECLSRVGRTIRVRAVIQNIENRSGTGRVQAGKNQQRHEKATSRKHALGYPQNQGRASDKRTRLESPRRGKWIIHANLLAIHRSSCKTFFRQFNRGFLSHAPPTPRFISSTDLLCHCLL